MTRREVEAYREELRSILREDDNRRAKLEELAKRVGAGYVHTEIACTTTSPTATGQATLIHQNPISEAQLVLNINNALQTETMIETCKTAARNYWIAFAAALAALLSALAAWVAIVGRENI